MAQNKRQRRISYLKNNIRKLEIQYKETKDTIIQDKLIRLKREYYQLTGVSLIGDLTTAYVDRYKRSKEKKGNPDRVIKTF